MADRIKEEYARIGNVREIRFADSPPSSGVGSAAAPAGSPGAPVSVKSGASELELAEHLDEDVLPAEELRGAAGPAVSPIIT